MNRRVVLPLLAALAEMGQIGPQSAPAEQRIQYALYDPNHVVTLQAAIGYAVVVELSDDERIENVVVGNSGAWQVTANKRGDHLVIKPSAGASPTDLVVTTDGRRYVFLLEPTASADATPFVVHFTYPQVATAVPLAVGAPTAAYKLRGDKALFPTAISDDGKRTTISWTGHTPLPAVFALDAVGKEAIVNGRMVDGNYFIEQIAPGYVFRLGDAHASATRELIKVPR